MHSEMTRFHRTDDYMTIFSPSLLSACNFLQDAEDLVKLTAQLTEARKKNDELKQLALKKAAHLKQKLDKIKARS